MSSYNKNKIIPIIAATIFIAIGLFSLLMTIFLYKHYKNFVCIMAAIGIILFHLFYMGIVFNNMQVHHKYIVFFVFGVIIVGFSATFIWLHNELWITIVLCALLTTTSIIKIILSPDRFGQIKFEMPALIIAFLLLFNAIDAAFWLMLIIISSFIILCGLIYFIYVLTPFYGKRHKRLDSINAKTSEIN